MLTLISGTRSDVPGPVLMSNDTLPAFTFAYVPIGVDALRPELMVPWSACKAIPLCVVFGDAMIKRALPLPPNVPETVFPSPLHPAAVATAAASHAAMNRFFKGLVSFQSGLVRPSMLTSKLSPWFPRENRPRNAHRPFMRIVVLARPSCRRAACGFGRSLVWEPAQRQGAHI